MQVLTEIRRKVLVEKVSKRQICRDYKISPHTLKKILILVEPPGYQQGPGERPRPKLVFPPNSGHTFMLPESVGVRIVTPTRSVTCC